jgi:uncharacterized protein (UPF0548 family)
MPPILEGMTATAKLSGPKTGRRSGKAGATYRGVRLQATVGQSRFTFDQIKNAVEAALEKNAHALAGRTKT